MPCKNLIIFLLLVPIGTKAQHELKIKNKYSGLFSLGVRSTVSAFNHGSWEGVGKGIGGQARLQVHDRINTEFFLDYLNTDLKEVGRREDVHIGWSVMYYLLKDPSYKKVMKPYLVAGHCFDYTNLKENADHTHYTERWSAAVQAGVGNHFNLTEHFDITLITQYMIHIGDHAEAHVEEGDLSLHEHSGVSLEGHLLFTVGVNYKLADLW